MGHQFVVELDNRPGELAHLTRALAARGINIRHLSCVGVGSLACAFITCRDDEAARDVLRTLGHEFVEGETVVADVDDSPGGLAAVTEKLAHAGVTVAGMQVVGRRPGVVEMAFSVDDEPKARETLSLTIDDDCV
jgi:hypothetical protein